MIKTGLKLAGPIIRGIKGISGKVKAKVAAGKAYVKGKVEAGKAYVKGKDRGGKGTLDEAAGAGASRGRRKDQATVKATPSAWRGRLAGVSDSPTDPQRRCRKSRRSPTTGLKITTLDVGSTRPASASGMLPAHPPRHGPFESVCPVMQPEAQGAAPAAHRAGASSRRDRAPGSCRGGGRGRGQEVGRASRPATRSRAPADPGGQGRPCRTPQDRNPSNNRPRADKLAKAADRRGDIAQGGGSRPSPSCERLPGRGRAAHLERQLRRGRTARVETCRQKADVAAILSTRTHETGGIEGERFDAAPGPDVDHRSEVLLSEQPVGS